MFAFQNTRVRFGKVQFHMHSIDRPWGEDDPILAQIREGTFDEGKSMAYWLFAVRNAPADALCLDVGAFAGLFSLVAAKARPDIQVVAFEPSAVTFGRLAYNIHLNRLLEQIIPAHLAAWSSTEMLRLPHRYGLFNLCPGESIVGQLDADHTETVLGVPLDRLLDDDLPDFVNADQGRRVRGRPVAAIKIDVEGAGLEVLAGAQKLIETWRPLVLVEVQQPRQRLIDFFAARDYATIEIPGERNILFIDGKQKDDFLAGIGAWKGFGKKTLKGKLQDVLMK